MADKKGRVQATALKLTAGPLWVGSGPASSCRFRPEAVIGKIQLGPSLSKFMEMHLKNFSAEQSEPTGRMINRVKSAVKSIPISATAEAVLDILGVPDERRPGLSGYLSVDTVHSVNELQSLVTLQMPIADETWMYVNPYRKTMMHFLAISNGKVERVWEVQNRSGN